MHVYMATYGVALLFPVFESGNEGWNFFVF